MCGMCACECGCGCMRAGPQRFELDAGAGGARDCVVFCIFKCASLGIALLDVLLVQQLFLICSIFSATSMLHFFIDLDSSAHTWCSGLRNHPTVSLGTTTFFNELSYWQTQHSVGSTSHWRETTCICERVNSLSMHPGRKLLSHGQAFSDRHLA